MSFILDALRKSEHARQRQTGPALAEVPIVAARPKSNVWATAAIALLIVNLVAIGVLLLRRAQRDESPAVTTLQAPAGGTTTDPGIAEGNANRFPASGPDPTPRVVNPTLAPDPEPSMTQLSPGVVMPEPEYAAAAPASGSRNPLAEEVSEGPPGLDSNMAARAASVPDGPPAVTARPPSRGGSVVYAPVPEAADATAAESGQSSAEALPSADEVVARGGVPPLHLDLHVYAGTVAQRFIFVNSRKYKQGDTLQEGPVVEEITREGAVLNFRGSRFRLSND